MPETLYIYELIDTWWDVNSNNNMVVVGSSGN